MSHPDDAAVAGSLPRYADRSQVPRDLRTGQELAAHGYERLGAPAAELVTPDGEVVALYSTSEARRLRFDLWPRGPRMRSPRSEAGAAAEQPELPLGAERRLANPGPTSRPPAGSPRFRQHVPLEELEPRRAAHRGDPRGWFAELFREGFVVLDTETTGLGARDEIIEVAAIGSGGEALLDSKVWPRSGRVPAAATRVHGLRLEDLEGAPTWPEVLLQLERELEGRRVLAWNAPFDERMARQSSRAWSLVPRLPPFECAMRGYAYARGIGSGSFRLERAALVERVLTGQQEHRSLGDARLTLAVLRRVVEEGTARA